MSVYSEVLATGGYIANHESDLYIEVNETNREILSRYPTDKANAQTFRNQVTGKLCWDVPFGFMPFWEALEEKVRRRTEAVVKLQHIINLFPEEPDVVYLAALAITFVADEALRRGEDVDPLKGSDFVPPSSDPTMIISRAAEHLMETALSDPEAFSNTERNAAYSEAFDILDGALREVKE